ncbi:MAG: putative rane protein [Streptosporangiaceae bacterium]|nr:putative rane protein [Streptosporangiaceae bacterium]
MREQMRGGRPPVGDRLRVPGLVLGLGLGGFVDGILLHHLLEWHHMLSSWYPMTTAHNRRINMIGDGMFHLLSWLLTIAGIALLFRAHQGPVPGAGRRLVGWIISGWGLFNLIEGIVDHLLLRIHHVRPGAYQLAYDLGFLILGAALVLIGWAIARTAGPAAAPAGRRGRP